jgi:hypothetical protein
VFCVNELGWRRGVKEMEKDRNGATGGRLWVGALFTSRLQDGLPRARTLTLVSRDADQVVWVDAMPLNGVWTSAVSVSTRGRPQTARPYRHSTPYAHTRTHAHTRPPTHTPSLSSPLGIRGMERARGVEGSHPRPLPPFAIHTRQAPGGSRGWTRDRPLTSCVC